MTWLEHFRSLVESDERPYAAGGRACALSRAADALGVSASPGTQTRWIMAAQKLGMTANEARSLAYGWDNVDCEIPVSCKGDPMFRLGRQLAARVIKLHGRSTEKPCQ